MARVDVAELIEVLKLTITRLECAVEPDKETTTTSPPLGSPSGLRRDLNKEVIDMDATYPNPLPHPTANQDNCAQDAESEIQSESAVDELELESILDTATDDPELNTIRYAPLHQREHVSPLVKTDCLKLWQLLSEYEDLRKGCKREILSTHMRPIEIFDWIHRKRLPIAGPKKIDTDTFGAAWRVWWWTINPDRRHLSSPRLRFVAATDITQWHSVDKGSRTGIRIAALSLFWWVPEGPINEDSIWAQSVADVAFVLEDMVRLRSRSNHDITSTTTTTTKTEQPTSKKLIEAIIPSSRVKRKHSSRAKLSSAKRRRVTK